jgi:hypothetical protein
MSMTLLLLASILPTDGPTPASMQMHEATLADLTYSS